jgi:spermidine synthase
MTNAWFLDEESRDRWIFHRVRRTVLQTRTRFCNVQILDTAALGRVLVLDDKIQSAELDEAIYHEALVHPAMTAHPGPKRVLILGGGEGATLREVLKHRCVERAVMVDIDGELVKICRKHLPSWSAGAFRSPRARIVIGDAVRFILRRPGTYDVIIADISDPEEDSPAGVIYTREFYRAARRRLRPGGIFVTQATEIFYDGSGIHPVLRATLASVFGRADSYAEYIPSFSSLWGFVAASDRAVVAGLDREVIARRLKERRVRTSYYCADMHGRMLLLPPAVRKRLARKKRLSTKKRPAFVYTPGR